MGPAPTHRRCSQTCSPTALCATCWTVGTQRSRAGLSPHDGRPWSGLCTECPGVEGWLGRKERASSLSNSRTACFFSSILLSAPHPATTSHPSSPSSSSATIAAAAPLLPSISAERLQPLPDTHSSLCTHTHLPPKQPHLRPLSSSPHLALSSASQLQLFYIERWQYPATSHAKSSTCSAYPAWG